MYDLIGDLHGCARSLEALLVAMGYERGDRGYRHPTRRVIFLGDFIDRGPHQRETLATVRAMVDAGAALAVMGNHEWNALAFHGRHPAHGTPLRAHSEKNVQQHRAFLEAFSDEDGAARREVLAWFETLPLWLERDGLRVVHACWHDAKMRAIAHLLAPGARVTHDLLVEGSTRGTVAYDAVETLLKGVEVPLPEAHFFHDKDGHRRDAVRVKWWVAAGTFRALSLPAMASVPDVAIAPDTLPGYAADAPPVFVGHYWFSGAPTRCAANVACLDYSVAKPRGRLAAYRWSGERELNDAHFVTVERREPTA